MAVVFIFLLGIANFAMHRAVLASKSPLLGEMPWLAHRNGRIMALAVEFVILAIALSLARMEYAAAGWAYGLYSACNALAAWLILSRRL